MLRTALKVHLRIAPRPRLLHPLKYQFSSFNPTFKLPSSTSDISNMIGYMNVTNQPTLTFWEKLGMFTPSNLYYTLDQFSRELLFTLANDYQLGLPIAVILISFGIRLSFFYINVKGQVAALKMKQIRPYLQRFKQQTRIAQMTRNIALMKSAKQQFKQVQKKKGIDNFYNFLNILQIPFLITWFISLRYVAALPQVYPSVTQGFLWVPDLSVYDPYFIFPIVSALLTSYSISISPAMRNANVMPLMQPFVKYMKYMPIFSLPITAFFPGIINIYWCVLAINQTILSLAMNSKYVKDNIVAKNEQVKPKIIQAVFVQQKPKNTQNLSIQKNEINQKEFQNIPSGQKLQILTKKPKKAKKQQSK